MSDQSGRVSSCYKWPRQCDHYDDVGCFRAEPLGQTGRSHSPLTEPPIRLCCMTRHNGVECPDGTFMCCLCFEKVPQADAWRDAEGTRWDCCKPCGDHDAKATPAREQS